MLPSLLCILALSVPRLNSKCAYFNHIGNYVTPVDICLSEPGWPADDPLKGSAKMYTCSNSNSINTSVPYSGDAILFMWWHYQLDCAGQPRGTHIQTQEAIGMQCEGSGADCDLVIVTKCHAPRLIDDIWYNTLPNCGSTKDFLIVNECVPDAYYTPPSSRTGSKKWICNGTSQLLKLSYNGIKYIQLPKLSIAYLCIDSDCSSLVGIEDVHHDLEGLEKDQTSITGCEGADFVYLNLPSASPTTAPIEQESCMITIHRDASPTGNARLGTFESDGLEGHTLEDEASMIGTGIFRASLYDGPRFGRKVILLNDSDTGREYIEIHGGNYVDDTIGCILPGDSRGIEQGSDNGAVWNSWDTVDALIEQCTDKKIVVQIFDTDPIITTEEGGVTSTEMAINTSEIAINNSNVSELTSLIVSLLFCWILIFKI